MSEAAADACTLWCVHTYLIDAAWISPRLALTSPEKGCGKTTLLDVLARLVWRPLPAANATSSALFRVVEMQRPTLLIDEADTFLGENEELRGILNSGHRRGGSVLRTVSDEHEPRQFSTYSACAIAMIGKLPATLADRSIPIDLKRGGRTSPLPRSAGTRPTPSMRWRVASRAGLGITSSTCAMLILRCPQGCTTGQRTTGCSSWPLRMLPGADGPHELAPRLRRSMPYMEMMNWFERCCSPTCSMSSRLGAWISSDQPTWCRRSWR